MASQEYSTMAAISRVVRSARDSALVVCQAMLPAKTEIARNAMSRSRSVPLLMLKLWWGARVKKSRQAAERREQKIAGPNPIKRPVKSTAAKRSTKRWRCRVGVKVQKLSATQAARAAPTYCAIGPRLLRAIQPFLAPVLNIERNHAGTKSIAIQTNFSSRRDDGQIVEQE